MSPTTKPTRPTALGPETPLAQPASPAPEPLASLLRSHRRPLAILFGLGLALRVFAVLGIAQTPYFDMLGIDMLSYQKMALGIVESGRWLPTEVFYQSPLYTYFLAVLYSLLGTSLWWPRVVNVLLGSTSVIVVYVLGVQLFTRRVALIAGVLMATYGPMILEDTGVLKTSLVSLGLLLATGLVSRFARADSSTGVFVAGLALGITAVGSGQALVALPALVLWWLSPYAHAPRARRASSAALFSLGCALPIAPVAAWNTEAGGGFLLTSADAGLNLYLGNNPRSGGLRALPPGIRDVPEYEPIDSKALAEREVGHPLTMAEVSRYWSRRAIAEAADDPLKLVHGLLSKLTVLWNSYEIPDNYHYVFMRARYQPWLWACPTFALLGPLCLLGLVACARRRQELAPLYVVVLAYLGALVIFHVCGRYRLAAVPLLVLFAAAGLEWLLDTLRARDPRATALAAAGLLGAALFVNQTYVVSSQVTLSGTMWFEDELRKLAIRYGERDTPEDREHALELYDEAFEVMKRAVRGGERTLGATLAGHLSFERGVLAIRVAGESRDPERVRRLLATARDMFESTAKQGYERERSMKFLQALREELLRLDHLPRAP